MADIEGSLPALSALVEQRFALVRQLADSLEVSQSALLRNDAEAIARGAAHQAELCRQWSVLEEELRQQADGHDFPDASEPSRRLQIEWDTLGARIRHLTRVHLSLLRHMQRSLTLLERVAQSSAPTYVAEGERWPNLEAQAGD